VNDSDVYSWIYIYIILKGALINTKRNRKIHGMAAKLTSRSGSVHLKRTRWACQNLEILRHIPQHSWLNPNSLGSKLEPACAPLVPVCFESALHSSQWRSGEVCSNHLRLLDYYWFIYWFIMVYLLVYVGLFISLCWFLIGLFMFISDMDHGQATWEVPSEGGMIVPNTAKKYSCWKCRWP
jgi:hypothetical protein